MGLKQQNHAKEGYYFSFSVKFKHFTHGNVMVLERIVLIL